MVGKPIPYWLYKLHGLGCEYECEVCGGYVYFGRKAFDAHFTEYRHGYQRFLRLSTRWGLKCLGLGNHKALWGVTGIQDVLAVQAKVEAEERVDRARVGGGEADEEMEDGDGNVYSRKVYEDLQRQGLI